MFGKDNGGSNPQDSGNADNQGQKSSTNSKSNVWLQRGILGAIVVITGVYLFQQVYVYAPDEGKLGGPIKGLTPNQCASFTLHV